MGSSWKPFLIIFFSLLLPLLSASAQEIPLVYRDLNVEIDIRSDGSATVTYDFTIENRASVPVVPGYGYFNLSSGEIVGAEAYVSGKKTEVVSEGKYARYSVWEVIKPGESLKVKLIVRISDFLSRGLLFDEFNATLGPFSYPVERGRIEVRTEGSNLVYLEKGDLNSLKPGEIVRVRGEVSKIPLPMLPFSWYPIFWSVIIVALALVLALSFRRKRS